MPFPEPEFESSEAPLPTPEQIERALEETRLRMTRVGVPLAAPVGIAVFDSLLEYIVADDASR